MTGIEREQLEREYEARVRVLRVQEERRAKLAARIAELQREIAPQTAEIASLSAELNPQQQWANLLSGQAQCGFNQAAL